ncbi:MAG TPA: hypothetical protein VEV65_07905 [Kineosporiaceae bacterium]|nr:hypothetical protein [Kineosporiaceae bacterium]
MVSSLERTDSVAVRDVSPPPGLPAAVGDRLRAVLGRVLAAGVPLVRRALRWFVREALPPIAVYAAIRLLGLVALVVVADHLGVNGISRLDTYDAPRLLGLAESGYDPLVPLPTPENPGGVSNIAFFPLYPGLVRLLTVVPGLGLLAAGYVVTALAGAAAAVGLDRFGRLVPGGRRAGLVLVALVACWPHSVVLAMPYTEALFLALAAWSLVAVLTRHWITGGVLALLAGATRPLGTALAGALVVAALVAVVRAALRERRLEWRPIVAAVLAPLGFLGYSGWLWSRTGRPDAWFWVQEHEWHSTFDGGRFSLEQLARAAYGEYPLVLVVNALVLVAAVVLLLALLVERTPVVVAVYALLGTLSVVGAAGYPNSKARFLLCVFPLLVPLVRGLARTPWRTIVVLLVGLALVSGWYNAFVLTAWRYSP